MLVSNVAAHRAATYILCFIYIFAIGVQPAHAISTKAHAQYYLWYGNPTYDSHSLSGGWIHWGEDPNHVPPDDLPAPFYPYLGAYSEKDPNTIHQHMQWLVNAGVGVICFDWWGPGHYTDQRVSLIMDIANQYGIKCCFMIDQRSQSAGWFLNALKYVIDTYGSKPNFFRDPSLSNRPVFYCFATDQDTDANWAAAWDSIRGTQYDSVVLMDWFWDRNKIKNGHWNGSYVYFVGSSYSSYYTYAYRAKEDGKIFVPGVMPGYDDRLVRPDGPAPIYRNDGDYYYTTWSWAYNVSQYYPSTVKYVSITSFNEWHEGTQIEPAVPKTIPSRSYYDYTPNVPTCYIDWTASYLAIYDPATSGKIQCEDYSGGASAQEGVDYHDTTSGNSGGEYRSQNVDIEECSEGGYNICNIAAGEWLRYTNVNIAENGVHEIIVRTASDSTRQLRICDGGSNNTILTLSIPPTGGTQEWRTIVGAASLTAGSHSIYLAANSAGFNLNWFEIRPDTFPPSAPTDVQAAGQSETSVRINWAASTDNTGVTGYKVFRNGGLVGTSATASYTDTGLTLTTIYSYTISAYDGASNESSKSTPPVTGTPLDQTPPSVPTGMSATTESSCSVRLAWTGSTDNIGVIGYRIYRNGTKVKTCAETSYLDTPLAPSTTYSYTVSAYDATNNESAQSSPPATALTGTADTVTPSVPENVEATALTPSSIEVIWDASTDNAAVKGYYIYRNGSYAATSTITSFVNNGLTPNTTYSYTVAAYDASRNVSDQSAPPATTATLPQGSDSQPPSVPSNIQAAAQTPTTIKVSWTASTDNIGVAGYRVYRNGHETGTLSATSFTDTGLTPSTTYSYILSAYDDAGNRSVRSSSPATATTLADLDIGAAKQLPNNSTVGMTSVVVTAVFDGCFYIEDLSKLIAIKVAPVEMPSGINIGDTVDVGGTIQIANGERYIASAAVCLK